MKHSESIKEIATALAKAQGQMTNVAKKADNPFFKSKYATLDAVVDTMKAPFSENGLSYVQTPVTNAEAEVGIETMLMHASGEWMLMDPYFVPVSKQDAQGFGSAITYCRRYSLQALSGIAPEDDDGNAAAKGAPKIRSLDDPNRPNTATQVAVDAFEGMSDEMKDFLASHAKEINRLFTADKPVYSYIEAQNFGTEERLGLWALLNSKVRARIKEEQKASISFLAGQA